MFWDPFVTGWIGVDQQILSPVIYVQQDLLDGTLNSRESKHSVVHKMFEPVFQSFDDTIRSLMGFQYSAIVLAAREVMRGMRYRRLLYEEYINA
jgi:hypothetical protein